MRPLALLTAALLTSLALPDAAAGPVAAKTATEAAKQISAEERALRFAPVLAREKAMDVLARAGARKADAGPSLDQLARALDRGRQALDRLDDALEGPTDASLLLQAERVKRRIVRKMVAIRIQRADLYAARPAMPNAREELANAKRLAGDKPELVDARTRLAEQERTDEENYQLDRRRDRSVNGEGFEGRRGGRFANDRRSLLGR